MDGSRTVLRLAGVAVALSVVSGCQESADPPPVLGPSVTVVNLNAAMGYQMGAGESGGTDANPDDLALLADDILGQRADIVNLQEMAINAARDLRAYLAEKTGADWQLNWAHSTFATYHPGKAKGEAPTYEDVSAGNAQLIRIGDGIRSQKPITVDGDRHRGEADQGIMLPSSPEPDRGRSFQGTEITTDHGVVDVYNAHLALARDTSDDKRAKDIEFVQRYLHARANPIILTGDFNQSIDGRPEEPPSPGELYPVPEPPNHKTVEAIASFMTTHGYTDVARDKGPTSDHKRNPVVEKVLQSRIDFILTRGVGTRDTAKFESHESDHWGLVTTIDPGSGAPPSSAVPSSSGVSADRYRQESPYSGVFYFFTSADGQYTCGLDREQAVCQGPTKPVPPRPDSCPPEGPGWGFGMFVTADQRVDFTCAGGVIFWPVDREPTDRDVLPKGQEFTALGFTCAATDSGIRCRQDASGHGFHIAPEANEKF